MRMKTKVAALFLMMGIILTAVVGYVAYTQSHRQVSNNYFELAFNSAKMAAQIVSGIDLVDYHVQGKNDEYYELHKKLSDLQNFYALEYLYIVIPNTERNESIYIFNIYTDLDNSLQTYGLGELETDWLLYEDVLRTFLMGTNSDHMVITDSAYGYLVSAFVPVFASDGRIQAVAGVDISMESLIREVRNRTFQIMGLAMIINIIFFIALLFLMQRQILNPVVKLSRHMKEFSTDDALQLIEIIHTGDELQDMSESFNRMVKTLNEYIENLETITADRERIATELNIATHIQTNMLPGVFPAFPDRSEFDIYASTKPAQEVGGDFYDYFLIDQDTLAVVVADVSGKGIPSALFMVIAKTLIKSNAQHGKSPAEVFAAVNKNLCENNERGMFVSAFMGYLDVPTGKLRYVNAGHNPPLIKRRGEEFSWLNTLKPGFVLGGMENMSYRQGEVTLNNDDELFLYTDGVTEAVNNDDKLFAKQRLLNTANNSRELPLKEFTVAIEREIEAFCDGAKQADDITMLVLRYMGIANKNELKIEAKKENMSVVYDFVNKYLEGIPAKAKNHINIGVDEVFSNISRFAYAPEIGNVIIRIAVGDEVVIEFEDEGIRYNPLENKDPDITLSIEERRIGGLGIFLLKKIMDDVSYSYQNEKNILTISKKIKGEG